MEICRTAGPNQERKSRTNTKPNPITRTTRGGEYGEDFTSSVASDSGHRDARQCCRAGAPSPCRERREPCHPCPSDYQRNVPPSNTGVPARHHLAVSRERRGAPAVEPCRKPRCRQDEERRTPPPALVSGPDDWTRKKEGPSMDPWAEPFLSTHKHARAISKDQPVPAH